MAGAHPRALTTPLPIKPTSPRCPSAWQPNPGRRSTYRRGKVVQTTGTSSVFPALFPQCSLPWLLTTAAWGGLTPTPESRCRWAYHHLSVSYHVIPGHHSFPLMFLQHTVEQDRAPAVLSYHAELARPAADGPPCRGRVDRRDHDQDRSQSRKYPRHPQLSQGHQGQQSPDRMPRH